MKTKVLLSIFVAGFMGIQFLSAQGFQPPSDGKAVVYFTRVSSYGGAVSFEFFHNNRYIGIFKGKNYMRYELEPGKQLLWASSENKEFVECDLEAGKTYIILVDIDMGAWKARVGLTPITEKDTEKFERATALILKEAPVITPEKKIEEMNKKLKDFIVEKLDMYHNVWKKEHVFPVLTKDMAISEEALK